MRRYRWLKPKRSWDQPDAPPRRSRFDWERYDALPHDLKVLVQQCTCERQHTLNAIYTKLAKGAKTRAIATRIEQINATHVSRAERESATAFLKELGL